MNAFIDQLCGNLLSIFTDDSPFIFAPLVSGQSIDIPPTSSIYRIFVSGNEGVSAEQVLSLSISVSKRGEEDFTPIEQIFPSGSSNYKGIFTQRLFLCAASLSPFAKAETSSLGVIRGLRGHLKFTETVDPINRCNSLLDNNSQINSDFEVQKTLSASDVRVSLRLCVHDSLSRFLGSLTKASPPTRRWTLAHEACNWSPPTPPARKRTTSLSDDPRDKPFLLVSDSLPGLSDPKEISIDSDSLIERNRRVSVSGGDQIEGNHSYEPEQLFSMIQNLRIDFLKAVHSESTHPSQNDTSKKEKKVLIRFSDEGFDRKCYSFP